MLTAACASSKNFHGSVSRSLSVMETSGEETSPSSELTERHKVYSTAYER